MGSTLPPPAHVPIQPGVGEKQHRQEGTPPFLPGWGELGTREGGGHLGSARRGHVPSPGDKHRCPERCCPWGGDGGDGRDNEGGGTRRDTWTGDLGGDTHGHLERLWPPGGGVAGDLGDTCRRLGRRRDRGDRGERVGLPGLPREMLVPGGGAGRDRTGHRGHGGGGGRGNTCGCLQRQWPRGGDMGDPRGCLEKRQPWGGDVGETWGPQRQHGAPRAGRGGRRDTGPREGTRDFVNSCLSRRGHGRNA